jgi:integrase
MANGKQQHQWENGVGKRCGEGKGERKCKAWPNCLNPEHPFWIKVQWKGDRKSGYGPASKFMFLWKDHQLPPQNRREAEILARRVESWLQQGKPMPEEKPTEVVDPQAGKVINDVIDGWLKYRTTKRRKLTNKGSIGAFESKVNITRQFFGERSLAELEAGTCLVEFVQMYQDADRKLATTNSLLATVLRPATRWAAAQKVPLITYVPFGVHRFHIDRNAESGRDTRCTPHWEAHLLDAFGILDDAAYDYCGRYMHDFTVCMIDLGPRPFELLSLCNEDIDWHAHRVTFSDTKYQGESRIMPFNPEGRVATIFKRRRFAGPKAPVICDHHGHPVVKVWRSWVHGVCIATGVPYLLTRSGGQPTPATMEGYKAANLVPYSLRHEFATWTGLCGLPDDEAEFLQGHKRQTTHGRYKHEALMRATAALREKVWSREGERAQLDAALERERLARQRQRA